MINDESLYAVFAEAEGHEKPLIQLELTFGRLIDDIIVPYQTDESFFIDGAPLTAKNIRRVKILKLGDRYLYARTNFHQDLTGGDNQTKKILGEQYSIRLEDILRTHSEDVTSQVLKAFNQVIKPSITDYLPKRKELISLATTVFVESISSLGS